MAIAVVTSSESGVFKDAISNPTQALGANVSVGDLVVVVACKENTGGTDPFIAADCTKSAGTATVGTITLDKTAELNIVDGPGFVVVGIWSCIVTGPGSLTMQVSNNATADYWGSLSVGAYSGSWDASRVEATNSGGSAANDETSWITGNVTTAGAALLIAGVQSASGAAVTITEDSGGGWTLIAESQDGTLHAIGSVVRRIVTTGGTYGHTWSATVNGNFGWDAAIVAYKEGAGGSGVSKGLPILGVG